MSTLATITVSEALRASPTEHRRSSAWACSTWVFLRLLGVVYLVAFWSLDTQILGLVGSDGIAPAHDTMATAQVWATDSHVGLRRFLEWPTVHWLGVSDAWLRGVCRAGMTLSIPLILGVGSVMVLPLLWLLYLSIATIAGEFLAFQWDALLLETGALAIVVAPWVLIERPGGHEPPRVARWLLWWLLFRLMFASGVVKLASGDPLWRELTALTVHYETQPLPTPLGWYAHQLPVWFQRASTAAVLLIELLVPWFIFGGITWKRIAAIALLGLQACIALTGNYAVFNLLSAALVLTIVDDETWQRLGRRWSWTQTLAARARPARRWQGLPAVLLAILVVPVSIDILARQTRLNLPGSAWILTVREPLLPLRIVNAYGLFAVMTPTRPEITIAGSYDGETWRPYEFRYKPGDLSTAPRWIAPHQPRLDWQMWFAALGEVDESPWFQPLCRRLLEGSSDVLGLLASNPFPEGPPRHIRATRARYHMTTFAERRTDGHWWTRGAPSGYFSSQFSVLSRRSRRLGLGTR